MKKCYVDKRFSASSLEVIDQANDIIQAYLADDYTLTVRQLYYQFVARDLIPNNMRSYKRIASIINDARLAGHIDWSAIEDRTRNIRTHAFWEDPSDILRSASHWYEVDMWEHQTVRPEVWIEKDALVGVIERVCNEWHIPYFACRGYASQSELWSAGRRLRQNIRGGQRPLILHLGDHDPSGMDMTRDNRDRLAMFAESNGFDLKRVALNFDQIDKYDPPPNPAKLSDSRASGYISEFGSSSWELDALSPDVINDIIESHIKSAVNMVQWENDLERRNDGRSKINDAAFRMAHENGEDY